MKGNVRIGIARINVNVDIVCIISKCFPKDRAKLITQFQNSHLFAMSNGTFAHYFLIFVQISKFNSKLNKNLEIM